MSAPGIQWHDDFNAFLIISKTFISLYQWNIISYELHKKPCHLFRTEMMVLLELLSVANSRWISKREMTDLMNKSLFTSRSLVGDWRAFNNTNSDFPQLEILNASCQCKDSGHLSFHVKKICIHVLLLFKYIHFIFASPVLWIHISYWESNC